MLTALTAALASNPPPNLPGFLNVVAPYLEHYSYWAVLLLVMLEDFGIPVPGETILIAASIFAGAGRLNIVLVGVVGFLAAVIGDNIGFAIGHFGGRALALRWGRYVGLTEERLNKAENFFDHQGARIIVVARFIEGLRQANGIIAGITGMHWRRFLVFNAIGGALWVGTWVSLGYLAGNHITTIYHYITQYSLYALIALVVVVVAIIIRRVVRRRRHRTAGTHEEPEARQGAETHETAATPEVDAAQDSTVTPEAAGTQGGENAATRHDTDAQHDPGAQQDAGPQDGAGTQQDEDGAGTQQDEDGAGTQQDAGPQNGAGTQESAPIHRS